MEKDYEVEIKVTFTAYVDVKGRNLNEAERNAINRVKDDYRLNHTGVLHIRENGIVYG